MGSSAAKSGLAGQLDTPVTPVKDRNASRAVLAIKAIVLLYAFLVGVGSLGDGFKLLGGDLLQSFFQTTSNPFIALMVGILSTTIVQSSSVTTSLVVGLVAAPENPLPLANAVPMIMGANIGTTVTNTLVSIAHMGRADEFRRAFAVATCHDFFNYMAVLVLLPLEIFTGFLSRSADWFAMRVVGASGVEFQSPIKGLIKLGSGPVKGLSKVVFDSPQAQGTMIVICAALLIFGALYFLVKTMRVAVGQSAEGLVERVLGRNALLAMFIGMLATMMVQSSSITTSLLVPIAGAGIITLRQAFPVTLGANVGTTVTALLAAMAVSGANAHFGVAIALTHFLFNVVGILIIYPVPFIRRLPLAAARNMASFAVENKAAAIGYIGIMFYGIPALFAILHS
jgi:solute carrier family 34 (sodium-dependent phosphate cotransporter)